ncbi:MAG: hypothetical protein IAE66_08270 [Xanthomonadaceae bacterium]|nr:hypothetical protein [Xanthomonadaceae bacterium]
MKARCLMMVAGMLLAGGALAQQPITTADNADAPASEARTAELPTQRPLDDHRCLRYTGSRITASRNLRDEMRPGKTQGKPRCAPAMGRSWSSEDLERTGALNTLDALRMLDPSIF